MSTSTETVLPIADHRVSRPGKGVIHRWGETLIPTTREAPNDAEGPSHILLSRAGYIRKIGSGIYDYLPLAHRTIQKISRIVRDEMDAAGASELTLPCMLPIELYAGTKRDENYGDLLFKVTDRKGAVSALGPTHEEPITELVMAGVTSYKQLPLTLYQVQTKFRDEARPRSGLLRCREFIMKDAYSFHMNVEGEGGLNQIYDAMYRAYSNVFTRCGLSFTIVEAESGPIGGSASHEFMVNAQSGEDTILKCPVSGYAANVEKCEIGARDLPSKGYFAGEPSGALEEVHTPGCPGIDDVVKFMKVKPPHMLKSVLFKVESNAEELAKFGEEYILAVVRGDHDVNEGKVRDAAKVRGIKLADPAEAIAKGFAIGFVSPRAAVGKKGVLLMVDRDAAISFDDVAGKSKFWVTGGDKKDYHVKHFNWQRDLGKDPLGTNPQNKQTHGDGGLRGGDDYMMVADVRNALAGDPSPKQAAGGAKLETGRGIEVGHIFKLGTKYSDAMNFAVLNKEQQKQSVIMGCYGIGVSRTMAASVEQNNDADGIIWPAAIAPYHALVVLMKFDDPKHIEVAQQVAKTLAAAGYDVLIDDRDERPGVKFKDADLIGLPLRITIGDKALEQGGVEFKARRDGGKGDIVPMGGLVEMAQAVLGTA